MRSGTAWSRYLIGTAMVEGKCPLCSMSIPVDPQTDAGICPYCGKAYVTGKALKGQASTAQEADPIEALRAKCEKYFQAGMAHKAENAALSATFDYPDDYRSWKLSLDFVARRPGWCLPYRDDFVDKADKLYRMGGRKDAQFEKWLTDYRAWQQKAQRVVNLCNALGIDRAMAAMGCTYFMLGDREMPVGEFKRLYCSGRRVNDSHTEWIQRFMLVEGTGLIYQTGSKDLVYHLFQTTDGKVPLQGNLVDALPALEQAAQQKSDDGDRPSLFGWLFG